MTAWRMFAGRTDDDGRVIYLHASPSRWYVKAYDDGDIVEVTVTEDPEGTYWGWIDTGESEPVMIQPHEGLYTMQFTYGPEAEERAGKGRTVQLRIEEA